MSKYSKFNSGRSGPAKGVNPKQQSVVTKSNPERKVSSDHLKKVRAEQSGQYETKKAKLIENLVKSFSADAARDYFERTQDGVKLSAAGANMIVNMFVISFLVEMDEEIRKGGNLKTFFTKFLLRDILPVVLSRTLENQPVHLKSSTRQADSKQFKTSAPKASQELSEKQTTPIDISGISISISSLETELSKTLDITKAFNHWSTVTAYQAPLQTGEELAAKHELLQRKKEKQRPNETEIEARNQINIGIMKIATLEELQSFITSERVNNSGKFVDFSTKFVGDYTIQGEKVNFGDFGVRRVINGLDVSNSNFPAIFHISNFYFVNCNFSNCKFLATSNVVFDSCNLTGADMSYNLHMGLILGGVEYNTLFTKIRDVNINALSENILFNRNASKVSQMTSEAYRLGVQYDQLKPTLFCNVNLKGATIYSLIDNYLVDWNGTDFSQTELEEPYSLRGKNLNLVGATIYPKGNPDAEVRITHHTSFEEIQEKCDIVVAKLIKNIPNGRLREAREFGISFNCSDYHAAEMESNYKGLVLNRPISGFAYNRTDLAEKLADFYNQNIGHNGRYNIKFFASNPHDPAQKDKIVVEICVSNTIRGMSGFANNVGVIEKNSGYIGIKTEYVDYLLSGQDLFFESPNPVDPKKNTLLHEAMHLFLGAGHPFHEGINPLKSSTEATIMGYRNMAEQIMVKIGNKEINVIPSLMREGVTPLDHKLIECFVGTNPNYKPTNLTQAVAPERFVVSYGDPGFDNIATIDTNLLNSLGIKYAVFNSSKSIGTCYEYPCNPNNLAEGTQGISIVLYKESEYFDRPVLIYGNINLAGGNIKVMVDGREIDLTSLNQSPAIFPITPASSDDKQAQDNKTGYIIGGVVAAGVLMLAGIAIATYLKTKGMAHQEVEMGNGVEMVTSGAGVLGGVPEDTLRSSESNISTTGANVGAETEILPRPDSPRLQVSRVDHNPDDDMYEGVEFQTSTMPVAVLHEVGQSVEPENNSQSSSSITSGDAPKSSTSSPRSRGSLESSHSSPPKTPTRPRQ